MDPWRLVAKAAKREKVNEFITRSKKAGIQRIGERAITLDDYAYSFQRIFDKREQMSAAISFRKKPFLWALPVEVLSILSDWPMVFLEPLSLGDFPTKTVIGWPLKDNM